MPGVLVTHDRLFVNGVEVCAQVEDGPRRILVSDRLSKQEIASIVLAAALSWGCVLPILPSTELPRNSHHSHATPARSGGERDAQGRRQGS
jgi:hypothetical protein